MIEGSYTTVDHILFYNNQSCEITVFKNYIAFNTKTKKFILLTLGKMSATDTTTIINSNTNARQLDM